MMALAAFALGRNFPISIQRASNSKTAPPSSTSLQLFTAKFTREEFENSSPTDGTRHKIRVEGSRKRYSLLVKLLADGLDEESLP